jgi:hypothetical protein
MNTECLPRMEFSHVALINTAHNLATGEKPAEQRSGSKHEPAEARVT